MSEQVAREVSVHGTVQGVGFRYYTAAEADRLGVHGWVRNEPDGSVTAHIEGTLAQVNAMLAWLAVGSRWARVTHVETTVVAVGGHRSFRITG